MSRSSPQNALDLALQRRPRQQACDQEQQRDHEQREGPDHGEQDHLGDRKEGDFLPHRHRTRVGQSITEHRVNRNHCNQDHLEVVKVIAGCRPISQDQEGVSWGDAPCRPSCRYHPSTVAAQDGEHKCRTALFPHGTGPADSSGLPKSSAG